MQSAHSFFLGRRAIVRKPVARPRAPAISRPADDASQSILCLQLACQLSADNAGELVAAVAARARTAGASRSSVVLGLPDTSTLDPTAAAALRGLSDLLENDSQVRLLLVLPGAEARAAFAGDSAGKAGGPPVHTTFRAAVLAAYASLPGAGLVTPVLRELLARPPDPLPLPTRSGFQGRLGA
jgi:hypothetical protein